MIGIEVITESLFEVPYLRIRKKNTFITGQKYELSMRIRNMGANNFPGGNLQMRILWPNGLNVFWNINAKPLVP